MGTGHLVRLIVALAVAVPSVGMTTTLAASVPCVSLCPLDCINGAATAAIPCPSPTNVNGYHIEYYQESVGGSGNGYVECPDDGLDGPATYFFAGGGALSITLTAQSMHVWDVTAPAWNDVAPYQGNGDLPDLDGAMQYFCGEQPWGWAGIVHFSDTDEGLAATTCWPWSWNTGDIVWTGCNQQPHQITYYTWGWGAASLEVLLFPPLSTDYGGWDVATPWMGL